MVGGEGEKDLEMHGKLSTMLETRTASAVGFQHRRVQSRRICNLPGAAGFVTIPLKSHVQTIPPRSERTWAPGDEL